MCGAKYPSFTSSLIETPTNKDSKNAPNGLPSNLSGVAVTPTLIALG